MLNQGSQCVISIDFFKISVLRQERTEILPTKVTQSKTNGNDEDCCGAANAVDKDLSTRASTRTDSYGEAWLKLEFDKSHIIDRIVIYYMFYTNWFSFGFDKAKYIEWIDNRSNVDVSVYQGEVKQKSCGTLQLTYGLEQEDQIYTFNCNTEGDTVKLSKFEDRIVVYEIVVLALAGISTHLCIET